MTDADLKKRLNKLVDFDDWSDKCAVCGRPDLLHKGPCTRTEKDSPGDLLGIWTEFRKRMKTVIRWTKASKEIYLYIMLVSGKFIALFCTRI